MKKGLASLAAARHLNKEGVRHMGRMFQVLGFLTGIMALMFLAGHMYIPAALFAVQTAFFFVLGSLGFTERTYMYLFGGYMFVSFVGMVWYATFGMH
jgi:formate-dependent nitrite reductase membrane component NrfD